MPQTKFQDIVFTILMVLIFVYVMTFYNAGRERDITLSTFGYALTHMWPEVIGAFIAQRYIASPVVKRLVSRLFTPGEDKPIFIIPVRLHLSHGNYSGASGPLAYQTGA